MSLHDDGKVYLEVGVNEVVSKQDNPNVPYGADEVAPDVVSVIRAGATAVHFHARYDDGRQAWTDDEVSRRVLSAAAREVDVLAYPSYHGSLEHIWALAERPPAGTRLLLTPFDPVQHVKRVLWLEEENRFGVVSFGPDDPNNSRPPYPPELDRFRELGLIPNIAVFNAADMRWVALAARIGILSQPLNIKLFFSDRWVSNNDPDPDVIDFLLSRIPAGIEHETVVVPYAMSSAERAEKLWERALDRGLGIRVGIGDCPWAFPTATNTEMVERAVELIQARGLEPATAADLRARCGVPAAETAMS
ncbi:3-keto-5-aminohexanoate cleavage protein [Nocardia sp. CA-135953]|uniref:3-keto-5-aminohexanoate cleavage protein n=1 Tax=Nocardia sp. CA-135953 TaxID=3239978 RepID=UPI003D98CAA4